MAAQLGRAFLLKMNTVAVPATFTTIAGCTARSISFNDPEVDVTTADSTGAWRELLPGASVRSVAISASGRFVDAATDETMRLHLFSRTHPECQIVVPGFGTYEGPFQITAYENAGQHDAEVTFTVSLASAGEITFTAA